MKVAVALPRQAASPGAEAARPPRFYTVPAEREITILDLLTHTSGLVSGPMSIAGAKTSLDGGQKTDLRWLDYLGMTAFSNSSRARAGRTARKPVSTRWDASSRSHQGLYFMIFYAQRVFDPLGMKDRSSIPPTRFERGCFPTIRCEGHHGEEPEFRRDAKQGVLMGGAASSAARILFAIRQLLANGGEFLATACSVRRP